MTSLLFIMGPYYKVLPNRSIYICIHVKQKSSNNVLDFCKNTIDHRLNYVHSDIHPQLGISNLS